jgi:hypothetical protein
MTMFVMHWECGGSGYKRLNTAPILDEPSLLVFAEFLRFFPSSTDNLSP